MSKSLVAQFQTLISPFGDEEVSKCIAALHKSGVVESLDECPQKLFEIVKNAIRNGDYPNLQESNLTQIVEDYFVEKGENNA